MIETPYTESSWAAEVAAFIRAHHLRAEQAELEAAILELLEEDRDDNGGIAEDGAVFIEELLDELLELHAFEELSCGSVCTYLDVVWLMVLDGQLERHGCDGDCHPAKGDWLRATDK